MKEVEGNATTAVEVARINHKMLIEYPVNVLLGLARAVTLRRRSRCTRSNVALEPCAPRFVACARALRACVPCVRACPRATANIRDSKIFLSRPTEKVCVASVVKRREQSLEGARTAMEIQIRDRATADPIADSYTSSYE